MSGLFRAELRKFASIRMTWVLIGSGIALSLMYVLTYALLAGKDLGQGMMIPGLETELTVHLVYSSIGMGAYAIAIVLGIVSTTSEYRFRTATSTFLVTPNRNAVLAAKWLAALVWGGVFAAIDLAICLPTAMVSINTNPNHFQLSTADLVTVGVGTFVGFALYASFGVAIGALVRNQVGAIVGALAWVLIVESILTTMLPAPAKYLPGGAMASLAEMRSLDGTGFLAPWQGGLLLLAYALGLALVAGFVSQKQDIS